MLGLKFGNVVHLKQLHGAAHLVGKNLDGPVHAAAATGHKPVQVGATDQSELRAQRHRGDNIGTVHNAGIDHHLGIHPYFTHYLREQVEGYGRTVQLTTAVVREQNAVYAQIGEFLRIFEVLHALNHDLAGPHFTDNLQVFIVDGGVHRVIQKLAHGAAGRGERGEFQLGRGQEVKPPPGARNRVQQGLHRQMRRNRETIALIAQASASNGCIHGEEERIESCLGGALYQSVGDFALAHDIQLEPEAAVRVCGAHILNAGSA